MITKCPLKRFWLSPAMSNAVIPSIVLLIFRLAWGWEMVESGWGHLNNVGVMVQRFMEWGVPLPKLSVYVSGCTELVGGGLLMLGWLTRFISIPLVINFCVAYAPHPRRVTHFFMQDPAHLIDDTAFPFLMASLLLLVFGAGMLSLDYWIGQCLKDRLPGDQPVPPPA